MKLFTANDIRTIDAETIKAEGITSLNLMERAASAVAFEVISRWAPSQRIVIFAGPGNNGGDALAVARLLIDQGFRPEVVLFNTKGTLSPDCEANRDRLNKMEYEAFQEVTKSFKMPEISSSDVVIDGLFGLGLSSSLRGGYTTLARTISDSGAYVVSIDMPSGLFADNNSTNIRNKIVHANLTLTFQFPKLAFFFRENNECLGQWKVLDINLNSDAIRRTPSMHYLIDRRGVKEALRPRNPFSDKNDYGRLLIVAGSLGMTGAAILTARAALRTGVGLVSVHAPGCCYIPLQTAVPEAIVDQDKDSCHTSEIIADKRYTVALGPGISTHPLTATAIESFLRQATSPVVLDADALNCIAEHRSLLNIIPQGSIITPHQREFDRLFGDFYNDEERFGRALEMAKFLKIVIVLKGHYSFVFRPDGKVFINNTGNPGMATAGSGDVLTGIIAALLAQRYRSDMAASLGVFIHGLAGNIAAQRFGEWSMTAGDIVDCVAPAIKDILEKD